MSLVGTLAKVAIGVAVAKGMKSMTGGSSRQSGSGGGLGDLLGGALGGGSSSGSSGGGIGDLLGGVLGGGSSSQNSGGGLGLDDLMGGLLKGNQSGASTGGGMGDILGKLGQSGGAGGLGDLLNDALGNGGAVTQTTTKADEDAAGLMIRAMLQAAKADGNVDQAERDKLLNNVGDLSQEEAAFINAELERDIDVAGLARDVPNGMEDQVYMMSVMGIDLDTQHEASYLHDLAQSMNLSQAQVNQIHNMLGVQPLYG